jgi:hypothetical protein
MPFDSTKPANNSPIVAAELRDQFNALQAQITALQLQMGISAPVLTANNATMSLDWTYSGRPCEAFFIFSNQSSAGLGVFNDIAHVRGDLRTWATDFDDPPDAGVYKYYIVPVDGGDNPVSPPSNIVHFASG